MVQEFLTAFYEMVKYHENNVLDWTESAGELDKYSESLLNHREQRELYTRLSVDHLEVVSKYPRLKDKLLEKLNHKILHYDAWLRERAAQLASQQDRILELSRLCQQLALALEPATMLYLADSRPPLANLLELTYDIVRLYALQHHKMLLFLNHGGRDKSAFLFAADFASFLQCVGSKS